MNTGFMALGFFLISLYHISDFNVFSIIVFLNNSSLLSIDDLLRL